MIKAEVRRANGERLRRLVIDPDFNPVLDGVSVAAYPMLSSIDPYGDTVFNHLQVKRIIEEIARYSGEAEGISEFLSELRELCVFSLGAPHRYLWFIGD